jgi:uncharacterized repeat protein (TIGR01451 family)
MRHSFEISRVAAVIALTAFCAACVRESSPAAPLSPSGAAPLGQGQPQLVSTTSIDFGDVLLNTTVSREVTVTVQAPEVGFSTGKFGSSSPAFSVGLGGGPKSPGDYPWTISFSPTTAGVATGIAVVNACFNSIVSPFDCGSTDFREVALRGNGVASLPGDLAVSMAGPSKPMPGPKAVTFSILVQNLGPRAATGVAVTDTLPSGSQFTSATTTQGSCITPPVGATGTVSCDVGTMPTGGTATIILIVDPTIKKGVLENTATVTADSTLSDTNPANNAATAAAQIK